MVSCGLGAPLEKKNKLFNDMSIILILKFFPISNYKVISIVFLPPNDSFVGTMFDLLIENASAIWHTISNCNMQNINSISFHLLV